MVDFQTPAPGTVQRAPSSNPISLLFKSVVGIFVGLLFLILFAPMVLWFAESQNSAKIFSLTKEVTPMSGATGYIRTTGVATTTDPIPCYNNRVTGNCLYYDYQQEELQYMVKDYCGALQQNQQVLEKKGQQCRRDNNDEEKCEQCYSVNESNWNILSKETKFPPFSLGNFKVLTSENAKIIGAEEYKKDIDTTHRESMHYIRDTTSLLVAGNSDGQVISDSGNKKYLLVSTKNYQQTYAALKEQDKFWAMFLRLMTLLILFAGYMLLFGPLSVMSNYVRKIPLIGRWIDGAVGFVIFFVSLLLALLHFALLWTLIIILKNIIFITIAVAVLFLLFYISTHFRSAAQNN